MTYRDFYTAVANANIDTEITDFANKALAKLDEKNEKKRTTASPKQKANAEIKKQIVEELAANPDRVYFAKEIADLFDTNTQHISALLKQIKDAGQIVQYDKVKDAKGNRVKGYQIAK